MTKSLLVILSLLGMSVLAQAQTNPQPGFIADFTCSFVHYFEGCIDDLLQYNRENMQLIGVTREEVMEFIKAGEQTTE